MASSRASTSAGRTRPAKRASAKKPPSRSRSGAHKAPAKKRAPAKPKSGGRKPPAKPRAKQAKPRQPKRVAPKPARSGPLASRGAKAALVAFALTLCLAAGYFLWFRDSSLVAIETVTVDGIEGPEAAAVTDALRREAEKMTTLNVDDAKLAAAASGFSTVVSVQSDTDFPHGLSIQVEGRPPVLLASDGDEPTPVAADGTVLPQVDVSGTDLATIQVESVPVKGALEGEPLALAQVAGAAPEPLRELITDLGVVGGEGIEVKLKGGIPVKFGDPDELAAKWDAVAAILANPRVETLTHLDVRVPGRPSIGGAAPAEKDASTSESVIPVP